MREILFKAKRLDNGEWVEGDLIHSFDGENRFAISNAAGLYEIVPYTICQYTGLTDKNGNKIWENDIVKFDDVGEEGYEYKEGFDFVNIASVEFSFGRWQLSNFVSTNSSVLEDMNGCCNEDFYNIWTYAEVIGNIFDNPELLEDEHG